MALSSPALLTAFDAQSFDSVRALAGLPVIPPDPSAAVGLQDVVTVTNGVIAWRTKDGTLIQATPLANFFTPNPGLDFFDSRVVYDPVHDRFVVVAVTRALPNGGLVPGSLGTANLYVAVSNDGDPSHGWSMSHAVIPPVNGVSVLGDFPMVGIDGNSVYIAANLFPFPTGQFVGSRLWTMPNALADGAGTLNVVDPSSALGLPFELGSLSPAKMIGGPPGGGTFLVSYNSARSGVNNFVSIVRVDGAAAPTFTRQVINVGDIDSNNNANMDAAQAGGGLPLDAGDSHVSDAVWQGGFLYAVATVRSLQGANLGLPEVHWFKFDTSNPANIVLVDQGEVDGSAIAPGTATFDASIAVDQRGSFIINFAASGPGIHPGAYYALHMATDAAGTLEAPQALAVGQDSYVRTFGGTENRWGDFSAASVDPANPRAFWLFNEYAETQGDLDRLGQTGRWGTRVGEVLDDHAPTVAAVGASVKGPAAIAAASLFQASDVDAGDTITQYELWDPILGDGEFTINGAAQAARQVIDVSSLAGLAWDTTDQVGSTVFAVRAFDGLAWSDWTTVTVTNTEQAPVVTGLNAIAHPGQTIAATSLFQVADGDGDPITGYELWDPAAGNGGFAIGGAPEPARQVIDVTPAQFATLAWDTTGQSGTTVFAVRATDGTAFGDWTTVAVTAGNTPPVIASGVVGTAHAGQSISATSIILASDAQNDPITGYELWDPLAGDGGFTVNGQPQDARQVISVPSLAGVAWDTTGQDGTTVIAVRATDGSDFGDWTVVTVQATDRPPVVTPLDPTVTAGQDVAAASLFQASDPDPGDSVTRYELWDPLAGDGNFVLGATAEPARQVIDLAAADLANLSWDATTQTGPTVVAVRAFDGTLWSDWTVVTVNKLGQALAASATAGPPLVMGPLLGRADGVSPVLAATAGHS